jgi:hypothetical protein
MVTSSLEQKERKTKAMMLSNKNQKQEQDVLGIRTSIGQVFILKNLASLKH